MPNIHQPNDKFFKAAFSYQSITRSFLEFCLPKNIVALLNLETLESDSTNYIGTKLGEYYSDVVYRCLVNGKETLIILLFEHKTVIGRDIYI